MSMLPNLLVTTKAVAKCVVGCPLTESNNAPTYGTPPNCAAEHPLTFPPYPAPACLTERRYVAGGHAGSPRHDRYMPTFLTTALPSMTISPRWFVA